MKISDIRREYRSGGLSEAEAGHDPLLLFGRWFEEARSVMGEDCNAMTLATADQGGRPSLRVVLLKGFGQDGFIFFSNYESRKGRELEENPQAALNFHWSPLERQVRIEGGVSKLAEPESERYFQSRPRLSRLAAAVSPQSREIPDRRQLEKRMEELEKRLQGGEVERPPSWGGYRVHPQHIEFWQGRPGRLHDRILFQRVDEGWRRSRLAP
ncbi:MAG TPA: pyridoxamine 5'-phosphate oxidase [Acidobacteriota bacterium]|nr:pyridoxamine 5'-phosphate oxidase [Acidobacteriota bacterium]